MGFFSKKSTKTEQPQRTLTKNYQTVLKNIKRMRIDQNHKSNRSLNEIGKDLAFIERKAKEYYNFTAKYVKSGNSQHDAYLELLANHTSSDLDRQILEKLFILKK